jgi:desulfoferrodoxin-like iron-binding protein
MEKKSVFSCEKCGKIKEIEAGSKEVPVCCGKPMKNISEMPPCDTAGTSEHGRLFGEDEPCKEQDE